MNLTHRRQFRRGLCPLMCAFLLAPLTLSSSSDSSSTKHSSLASNGFSTTNISPSKPWQKKVSLLKGQAIELSVRIPKPSILPLHSRVGVAWLLTRESEVLSAPALKDAAKVVFESRKPDAFEIYTKPTANWRKMLHALDPDAYVVYRAPVSGDYLLEVAPVEQGPTPFEGTRWRESGLAPTAVAFPRSTPWPKGASIPISISLQPFELGPVQSPVLEVETEPNGTPEMAQRIALPIGDGIQRLLITAGADDIEYFDNGKVSGDDWFQFTYEEQEPKLLTCNLAIPDLTLAARLGLYTLSTDGKTAGSEILAHAGGMVQPAPEWPAITFARLSAYGRHESCIPCRLFARPTTFCTRPTPVGLTLPVLGRT